MNNYTNLEKNWNQFPCLEALILDKSVPPRYYHNSGLRSPSTTQFDDLHDFVEISAIITENRGRITDAVEHDGQGDDATAPDLLRDLDHSGFALAGAL